MALGRRLPVALLVVALAACGGGSKKSAVDCTKTNGSPTGGHTESPPTKALPPGSYSVVLKTNYGSFTVGIARKTSPNLAASFVSLVRKGFFDGTVFHRIVPGFVIQGGDPTGTGEGGPGYACVDVPPATTAYTHGVVAMAKTSSDPPGTSGSQFFVVTAPNAQLPADYAVLGNVTAGIAVVDRIGTFGNASEQPTRRVVIQKATVHVG